MRLALYCIASFLLDFTFYVLWTVLPFHALRLGADDFQLGALPMVTSATYIVLSITSGWLSDRLPHAAMLRSGLAVSSAGMLLAGYTDRLWLLYVVAPITSVGTGIFWPAIQNAIGKETRPEKLDRALGLFNVAWSIGKALGFFVTGSILAWLGTQLTLQLAALATALTLVFIPPSRRQPPAAAPDPHGAARPSGFLRAAWVGNFAAFGVSSILNVHYPKFLVEHFPGGSEGETFGVFGNFLGVIFTAQTLAFLWLLTSSFWTYRWTPIILLTAVLGAATAALPEFDQLGWVLCAGLPIGAGLGMAYSASIFYSLHGPKMQGLRAGVHEAVIGSASVLLPPAGGYLARSTGELRWPYWTAALGVGAALLIQAFLARGSRRRSSQESQASQNNFDGGLRLAENAKG